jgi:hypothetical protein
MHFRVFLAEFWNSFFVKKEGFNAIRAIFTDCQILLFLLLDILVLSATIFAIAKEVIFVADFAEFTDEFTFFTR